MTTATTEQTAPIEQLIPHFIVSDANFDFNSLASGTPVRVSPKLIDDLSIGGNLRRDSERDPDFLANVRDNGVIQSLSVRPNIEDGTRLELCAGYGRRDAALKFDLESVPVIVNKFDDKAALAVMLSENKHRKNISIVDEADLAQTYLSLHDGDYASAALQLGISEPVLRERLQLKRCNESVLEALLDKKNKFTLGHAKIISTFDEETQEATLKSVLADPVTYSVEELKLRASKRSISLSKAPFDTSDCQSCKHNTGEQLDLLSFDSSQSKCSNGKCFAQKAKDWVGDVKKAELEERFGTVILWLEKPESERRTVSSKELGKQQFESGCTGCKSNCVILDDRPMKWGQHVDNQCVDTDCFSSLKKAHKDAQTKAKQQRDKAKAEQAKNDESTKVSQGQTDPSGANVVQDDSVQPTAPVDTPQDEVSIQPVKKKTSAAVLEDYKSILRQASAATVVPEPLFRMAFALASLVEISGYVVESDKFELDRWSNFNIHVIEFMKLSIEEIQSHMGKAVIHHATVGTKEVNNPTSLMISALQNREDGIAVATTAWEMNAKRLAQYTIAQIKVMCEESGFGKAYENDHGLNSFSALFKDNKSEIVKKVMAYKFDWAHYAPSDYLELVSQ
ncbi:ParB/RepB/Spo0J family partition protein [Vibrio sp. 10N.261.46.E12]|uniref:ParB/RepB/Spo0J family partition protein n=1 Tax=unclassified Vibrio TaxID=2614977 RepID=UPI000975ACF3|nr:MULTISPECIES: ParB/RepB/Spo0J family partition protein [unclassified Vibrio]OMO35812.1 hypothetical protein BH584_06905 [Vibrio sp. 10N.261.45.E1]PMJ34957.1 hypothetical protein BCU27_24530 [Vibrio sp. 10N.286.45.B6]PML86967.1 hypothetical protein BCT66_12980 [Vibrio sp. 10N.261.49.E11]PMM75128.1 hypothetical protein BCT48_25470 [Vibrio sp. 10N.261.46.F12]PMM85744.1 hypothetical protein BCT46_08760 [Vibrio sp. 10N.261.46.E8]